MPFDLRFTIYLLSIQIVVFKSLSANAPSPSRVPAGNAENPVSLDSALIEEKYEDWIQAWNDEVLVNY